MMTDMRELRALMERARKAGAQVDLTYDARAWGDEGRAIISTVRVQGMAGIGPYPMPAICAAERLREALAQLINEPQETLMNMEKNTHDERTGLREPIDVNPFADSLGVLYALGFVAVAIAAYRTGMRHVVGVLPLWAIVATILAAGCVLMHWAKWSEPVFLCPLAVVWTFQALWLVTVDSVNTIYPPIASVTPLADPVIVQWAIVASTIGFGAAAVFAHFKMLLLNQCEVAPPEQSESTVLVTHSVQVKP